MHLRKKRRYLFKRLYAQLLAECFLLIVRIDLLTLLR